MWHIASTRYVYDEGVKRRPSISAKLATLFIALVMLCSTSVFSVIQLNNVVSAAVRYSSEPIGLPDRPSLGPVATGFGSADTQTLTEQIEAWIYAHPGHQWSVSIKGLSPDSRSISVGNRSYAPASLYKILMLPALFERYSLEDFEKVQVNEQNLRVCVEKMLLQSDNVCGEAIANNILGWGAIDQALQQSGYNSLKLNNPQGMTVTPDDMVRFMADFEAGKLTPKPARDYVLELLARQQFRAGIPSGCTNCKVMNKTGDKGIRHDVAIIRDGQLEYALGIFSSGGSYREIAELTQLIQQNLQ